MATRPWIAVLLLAFGCSPPSAHPDERPNVLLVTIDTLRADYLGSYGHARPTSPNLDALAARSVLFEHAIAQSAVTPVSHASIFTGLYPHHHGLRSLHGGAHYRLPDSSVTLAELFAANDYATAGFVSAFPATRHFGLDQGFATWDEAFDAEPAEPVVDAEGRVQTGNVQRRADATTDLALDWLEEATAGSWLDDAAPAPFFLWVHYFDVHDEALVPPRSVVERFPPRSTHEADLLRALYEAELAWVDAQIGRLLEALDERGRTEHTIVAVLSDHGEGLGDHAWWGHSVLYQEQVRVPLLLRVPGTGWVRRVEDLVRTIDLAPTLVDLAGLSCPKPCAFDGESLRGLAAGEARGPRLAQSESLNDLAAYPDTPYKEDSLYAVNDGRWKLIARYRGLEPQPSWLFDLEQDPGETANRIEARPDVARRLRARLELSGAIAETTEPVPLEPAARERLRALGYVE